MKNIESTSFLPASGSEGSYYAVDLPAWVHRYIHACGSSAHKAFRSLIEGIQKKQNPSTLVVMADCISKTFRHDVYDLYKSNRKRTADEQKVVSEQLVLAKEQMAEIGVAVWEKDGFEAEDLIASSLRLAGWTHAVIVGSDKDLAQLVRNNVLMWDAKFVSGPREVFNKFGVKPRQIVDYLSMVGDTSDSIPGVPHIGEVGAASILLEHGSLGQAMAAAASTPSTFYNTSSAKWLRAGVDSARLSKKLIRLRFDVDLGISDVKDSANATCALSATSRTRSSIHTNTGET